MRSALRPGRRAGGGGRQGRLAVRGPFKFKQRHRGRGRGRRAEIRDEEEQRRRGETRPGEKRNSLFGRLNNLGTAGEQRRRLVDDAGMIK